MSGLAIIYRMVVILVPSLRYLYLLILNIWPVFRVICGSLKDVNFMFLRLATLSGFLSFARVLSTR